MSKYGIRGINNFSERFYYTLIEFIKLNLYLADSR